MRRLLSLSAVLSVSCMALLFAGIATTDCGAQQPAKMEILFMNHGPMQPTIRNLKSLIKRYPGKVQASWFDFDQQSGKAFMRERGIKGHVPLLIFINGAHTYDVGGKMVTFMGFPTGAGPYQFQGKWTFQDLELVLQSLTR